MNELKNIGKELWVILKHFFNEYFLWKFRRKSIFKWVVRVLTLTVILHISDILADPQFDAFYSFLETYLGLFAADLARALVFIFFPEAPLWLSLTILAVEIGLLVFFALLEWKKFNNVPVSVTHMVLNWKSVSQTINNTTNYYFLSGTKWEVNDDWIAERARSLYGALSNVKYTPELHIKTSLESAFLNILTGGIKPLDEISELIAETKNWAGQIFSTTAEIKRRINDRRHPLILNENSALYPDFIKVEEFAYQIYELLGNPDQLQDKDGYELINPNGGQWAEFPIQLSELSELINIGRFDLVEYADDNQEYEATQNREVFNAFSPFLLAYRETSQRLLAIRNYLITYNDAYLILTAEAGMGKTHFAASLYEALKSKEHVPFFLKGSDFSGADTNLPALIMKLFEVPDDVIFEHFLEKLNEYATSENKLLVFIIDSLNETTYMDSGFSPIWREHLKGFIDMLSDYDNLKLVVTFRDSYFDLIDADRVLGNGHKLEGFADGQVRRRAVETYFKYFKLKDRNHLNELPEFFKSPLMLNLFCRSKNENAKQEVSVNLANETYLEVLYDYVREECSRVAIALGYPLPESVLKGIDRNSDEFLRQAEASLSLLEFLVSTDGKSIDQVLTDQSVACHLLDSEALFMKEKMSDDRDRVVHTFQNVGGYLLALKLIAQYSNPEELVKSEIFRKRLAGAIVYDDRFESNNQPHQLWADIMRFLVMIYDDQGKELMRYSQDLTVMKYSLEVFVLQGKAGQREILQMRLGHFIKSLNGWFSIFDYLLEYDFSKKSGLDFLDFSEGLRNMSALEADLIWSRFVYVNGAHFVAFLESIKTDLEKNRTVDELKVEAMVWLLNSTIQDVRDSATYCLIKYGTTNPDLLFDRLKAFATSSHTYVYGRLAMVFYGVCLRNQNDSDFTDNELPNYSKFLYNLQFASKPQSPSYNYLVIDSYKHLIELAVLKGALELSTGQLSRLKQYKFSHPKRWKGPTKSHKEAIKDIYLYPYTKSGPDPLQSDFVNYTIPSLMRSEVRQGLDLVAQVYRLILDFGYKPLIWKRGKNDRLADFFSGRDQQGVYGKTERLGKKYSWMAYFEYAGYLLKRGELNARELFDNQLTGPYKRLSDVRVEVSVLDRGQESKLINATQLLKHKTEDVSWVGMPKYDTILEKMTHNQDKAEYVMLHGKIEENLDKEFKVRSFVDVEAYLVNQEDLETIPEQLKGKEVDWTLDIHRNNYLSRVYFGELYWSDNISDSKTNVQSLVTGKVVSQTRLLSYADVLPGEKYEGMEKGDQVTEEVMERMGVEMEPATVEYLWETGSNVFPTMSRQIPSEGVGKFLGLKADCRHYRLLDNENNVATLHYHFKDNGESQEFMFLRKDLLKKYLEAKGLVLMYQVKQHTYDRITGDGSGDFRGMQYFFPDLG